jgi:tetratricopeptide (TPR) repeat protein
LLATCPDDAVRDADKAIERAKRAIELDGQMDSLSYDTLAAAQANAGDFQSAEATLRQAIDVAADNEREVYLSRLQLYQRSQPYRIAPVRNVSHASFEAGRR